MNHGTSVSLNAAPNGDLTLTNRDGTITIRKDGTISISTVAPIELTGETIGKLDELAGGSLGLPSGVSRVLEMLQRRGRKS